MSSNTTNLNLYKADPVADGNNTFNIKTMLNDNWDKIDTSVIAKFLEAKGYTDTKIQQLINSSPGALDTLKELADALGDDANFSATMTNALALKAPLASPILTGTPSAPTPTADTNTTQIATTAFVLGQAGTTTPNMDGAATTGTSKKYARADHVHPSDATKANVASPILTGTPSAPTPAADTNTTQIATTAFVLGQAGTAAPQMDGTGAVGTSNKYARADHVHPSNTTKANVASPTFTGTPSAPTPAADTNTTQIATTAFVLGQAGATTPNMDGTATTGTSNKYARADHVHPSDATKANVASPILTGTPSAPTPAADTNTTQIATTAFVLGQAGTTIPQMDGTGAAGTSNRYARTDHVHPSDATKANVVSPILTGIPSAPTPAVDTNTTQIATTAFVLGQAGATTPNMDGAATTGTSNKYARADHVHPSDTTKANLVSPTFTGTPSAPTPAAGTNTTQIATTAFVSTAVANLVSSAPSTLDTLNELATALGDDPNFATTMTNALATKAPLASPTFTGTPAAPTPSADTNTTQIATTAFVLGQAGATTPQMDGAGATGTSNKYARADHVHPSNTTKANLASPTFTGTPSAPTPAADTNTTQIATTAFVLGQAGATTPQMDGTGAAGTSNKYARTDHVHPRDTTKANVASPTFTGIVKTANNTLDDGSGNITASGVIQGTQLKSTVTTGTAPLNVSSTTIVNNLNADLLDGIDSTGFSRAYSLWHPFGKSNTAITTADFITMLTNLGAFNQPYWVARGSWSYADNQYISDTGIGNIHLAGCTVEVMGGVTAYTIRIHTPTTSASGVINTEFIYVNNGSSYSPGWRKIWNNLNDGSGSGMDADLLDGQHGSYYAPIASPTFTGTINTKNNTLDDSTGNMTLSGTLNVNKNIQLNTNSYPKASISFYSPTFDTWQEYMANSGAGKAINGTTASSFGPVTSWARRSLIENIPGYGWIWESTKDKTSNSGTSTNPTPMMALDSANGNLTVRGNIISNGNIQATAFISGTQYLNMAPASGGQIGFTNNARSKWGLMVADNGGNPTAQTLNNVLDDGSGGMVVNGPLYFKQPNDNTDTMYITKTDVSNDLSLLDIVIGDNGTGTTIATPPNSTLDYLSIKSSNLGIHHLFGSDGSYVAASSIKTSKFLAGESPTTAGGYSFYADGAQDTGMFSPSDGVLDFYCNGAKALHMDSSTLQFGGNTVCHTGNEPSVFSGVGYKKFADGLIIQWWGSINVTSSAMSFPMYFPNSCLSVIATVHSANSSYPVSVSDVTRTGCTANNATCSGGQIIYFVAIGY